MVFFCWLLQMSLASEDTRCMNSVQQFRISSLKIKNMKLLLTTHWKISLQQLTCCIGRSLPHQHHFHANLAKILSTEFHFFLLWSEIVQEPKKLEKHKISHLKALFYGNVWLKVQTVWTEKTENFWSKFWQDSAWKWCWWGLTSPWHMSIAGVKSSNV